MIHCVFRDSAAGLSRRTIAACLNKEGVPGPRSGPWGASTIYGNPKRGTGLLNNELYAGRRVWNRQRLVKDPATGRRQARPNDEAALIAIEAPELRIVEQDLWDAVKVRQLSATVEVFRFGAWDRRRPRYLFSGLIVCGCCGSGYAKVGANRFGCSAARNKGAAICNNRVTAS